MTGLKKMKSKKEFIHLLDDLDIIVKALASELQGYDGYFKQNVKRMIKNRQSAQKHL